MTLKEMCKSKGITLLKLGQIIGRSKQYMSDLSAGKINPYYQIVIDIANALSYPPEDIFLAIKSSKTGSKKAS